MRKTLIAGIAAGALVIASTQAPSATAQTKPDTAEQTADTAEALRDAADAFERLSAEGGSSSAKDGAKNKDGDASGSSLELDPENDPLYIDPEKNPLQKVSSSEMFLEWTDGMPESEGKDVVQAWAANSSIPNTANPVELWKQEAQGSSQMSSGLFTGDFETSSAGSSQATSVLFTVMASMLVIGSLIELVMRGIRMAQQ